MRTYYFIKYKSNLKKISILHVYTQLETYLKVLDPPLKNDK